MRLILVLLATLSPAIAAACGGLFCDSVQPVTQAAERIVFGPGEAPGTLQMHVQIVYAGPPAEFGWLLPAPADVQVGLSSATLFGQLDRVFGPLFQLRQDFDCDFGGGEGGAGGEGGMGGGGEPVPDVAVLGRADVGPYDQVILQAAQANELLLWLSQNDFNAPLGSAEMIQEYIDGGSVFVALKLLPSAGVNDVAPIYLEYTGAQPTVPIKATALAAQPDMGLIVHSLGAARAVPTNYLHVEINERAIDWLNAGANYADVVSQAVDEAEGQAFTTDFAGRLDARDPLIGQRYRERVRLNVYSDAVLADVQAVETLRGLLQAAQPIDPEIINALAPLIDPPAGLSVIEMFADAGEHLDHPIDGVAIAAALAEQINPRRARINAMFDASAYMTRLYTTLSPDEMTLDPLFTENVDVADVDRVRRATVVRDCDSTGELVFSDGGRVALERGDVQPGVVRRAGGRTVRGEGVQAAALIVRHLSAGQPEIIRERPTDMPMRPDHPMMPPAEPTPPGPDAPDPAASARVGGGGCAIDRASGAAPLMVLGLLGLLVVRRRRA